MQHAPVLQVGVPADPVVTVSRRRGRRSSADLYVVVWILVLVLTQRLAIPLGGGGQQLPVAIPAALLVVSYGVTRGHAVIDRRRCILLGIALATVSLLTLVAVVRGLEPSLFSEIGRAHV